MKRKKRVLLMGNPNVGKSTVFNEITGSHQHTGNWTGKTVDIAKGEYYYKFSDYELIDLPGTYSLLSSSEEERLARDYLCFEDYDCVVCVVDATNLLRNLNLVLQVIEVTDRVVLLLNLADEARKKNIEVDIQGLSNFLGVPVVKATARSGKGINDLLEQVHLISNATVKNEAKTIFYLNDIESVVKQVQKALKSTIDTDKNLRFFALRLLENDESFNNSFKKHFGNDIFLNGTLRGNLNKAKYDLAQLGLSNDNYVKSITSSIFDITNSIVEHTVKQLPSKKEKREKALDKILMGKYTSIPVMLLLFGIVLWITIAGSNYPSDLLRTAFDSFEVWLADSMINLGVSQTIVSLFVNGVLRVLLWVVAVMLPPMAIFFPLFALLEDFGVLPRIAFNLDGAFERCGACGKQALTTCMGYGCNAVGVTGCRIIDSPRERLVAIITNSLSPCNGRFPLLIAIISMFFCSNSVLSAGILLGLIAVSMMMTFATSKVLTSTVLKGVSSSFVLELPPYRKPKILSLIGDTIREKIIFVLFRAVVVAAPAGLIIWVLANINIADTTLLCKIADVLDPVGHFIGLDGVMLLAFILGFPANEIVIPIALMAYLSTGEMGDYSTLESLKTILVDNGWTWVTALCTCIFSMFHFPCSTTLLTIWKETKSVKWTLLSVLTPLLTGVIICALINFIF
ncbi:MAG: ferrous iron transport protein B [Eubacterium sp.]|nr:ferrous iron transport protein B [Eubacterium sp.]